MTATEPGAAVARRSFGVYNASKHYGGVVALRQVSAEFRAGEIVGLVGKNGAGKSTLIKILAGATTPDAGEVRIDGHPVHFRGPHEATLAGISVVHQELALVPGLSVAENVWLGLGYPRAAKTLVRRSALRERARAVLARVGMVGDVDAPAGSLSIAAQRLVMIARGLAAESRLLILDEPSASFTDEEIRSLHAVVRSLAGDGVGVVYVSHRVDEILALTDRVVVMRNGMVVEESPTAQLDKAALVRLISGPILGEPTATGDGERTGVLGEELLRADHLAGGRGNLVRDASLAVHEGEILGIAGLVGSGRTEFVRMLFGCEQPSAGTIAIGGQPVRLRSPRDAVRRGVVLVPEDRRQEGSLITFSVRHNMTLPSLPRFRAWRGVGVPHRGKEYAATDAMVADLGIVVEHADTAVDTLSGGNQQKVVVGKWLLRDAGVFIFDEPSIGIDVEAKAEMFRRIALLAQAGKAVIVVSSEFEELQDICDRVVVMREGVVVGELTGADITEANMLAMCYSDRDPAGRHRQSA